MKKLLALVLALMMCLSFAACGDGKSGGSSSGGSSSGGDSSGGVSEKDLEKVEDALEKLGTQLPDGWSDGNYWMLKDGWDADFLPSVLPAPQEGFEVDITTLKDYKHDTMDGDYEVGDVQYASYKDYREYGVQFDCNPQQLEAYIEAVRANGFVGGGYSDDGGEWEYHFSHPDGWLLVIYARSSWDDPNKLGAAISMTDSLYDSPKSVCGLPLPTMGTPVMDFTKAVYNAYDSTKDYEEVELPVDLNGSFPDSERYEWDVFFEYDGVSRDYVMEYSQSLTDAGWEVYLDEDGDEDYVTNYASKDGLQIIIGFSDSSMVVGIGTNSDSLYYY